MLCLCRHEAHAINRCIEYNKSQQTSYSLYSFVAVQYWPSRWFKVDDFYLIWKGVCLFLLVMNNNLGCIFHCFRDMTSFPFKTHIFQTSLFNPKFENVALALPWNRANYSCKKFSPAAYPLARVQTDRQTDEQTTDDNRPIDALYSITVARQKSLFENKYPFLVLFNLNIRFCW